MQVLKLWYIMAVLLLAGTHTATAIPPPVISHIPASLSELISPLDLPLDLACRGELVSVRYVGRVTHEPISTRFVGGVWEHTVIPTDTIYAAPSVAKRITGKKVLTVYSLGVMPRLPEPGWSVVLRAWAKSSSGASAELMTETVPPDDSLFWGFTVPYPAPFLGPNAIYSVDRHIPKRYARLMTNRSSSIDVVGTGWIRSVQYSGLQDNELFRSDGRDRKYEIVPDDSLHCSNRGIRSLSSDPWVTVFQTEPGSSLKIGQRVIFYGRAQSGNIFWGSVRRLR